MTCESGELPPWEAVAAFCLAAGTPIVFGLRGEAAEILTASGAGIGFEPGDAHSCAEALRRLLQLSAEECRRMGNAGRKAYEEMYERTRLVDRYRALFLAEAARVTAPPSMAFTDVGSE